MRLIRAALMIVVACLFATPAAIGQTQSGGVIAFAATTDGQTGPRDIYLLDTVNGNVTNLTQSPSRYYSNPVWSPDGSMIAFGYNEHINILYSDTGESRTFDVETIAFDLSWTPDSQFVAFSAWRRGVSVIYLINVDNGRLTTVISNDTVGASVGLPLFSPDGKQLAVIEYHEFYLAPSFTEEQPDVGWYIVVYDLHTMQATGMDMLFENRIASLSWSPDSQTLLFYTWDRIYTLNVGTSTLQKLTDEVSGLFPEWSPDGSQITVASSLEDDIYVMNADGTDIRNVSVRPEPDWNPAWSPDGNDIAFVSRIDGKNDVYLVTIETGETRQLTNAQFASIGRLAWQP